MTAQLNGHIARRFLFSISGGYGHLHPLVPLASALKRAGHEVAFAAGASLGPLIEAAGFPFFRAGGKLAADPEYQEFSAQRHLMPVGLETELLVYARVFCGMGSRLRTPDMVEIARQWRPDMIVREAAEYSAMLAAQLLGLPYATVSFAASLQGFSIFEREVARYLDPVRESWGLPPDPALVAPYRYLYLAYSPPTFSVHDVEVFGLEAPGAPRPTWSIPSTTHFLRPEFFDSAVNEALPEWVERLRETGRPILYVTLGTEVNSEPGMYPRVLQTIIAGLRDLPANLIVTLGRDKDPSDFGPQPANVHIERYIPQSLLLPHCDLMVMHGGSNTLLQALDAGLPTVVVPLIADQFFNAEVAQRLQLGQVVQTWQAGRPGQVELGQITPASIRATVEETLANPIYRRNVASLQAEMQSLPGQQYAVELVERVAAMRQAAPNT